MKKCDNESMQACIFFNKKLACISVDVDIKSSCVPVCNPHYSTSKVSTTVSGQRLQYCLWVNCRFSERSKSLVDKRRSRNACTRKILVRRITVPGSASAIQLCSTPYSRENLAKNCDP